jgi:hypothetical protein
MRIHEYYRTKARLSLNGSIVALLPAIFIVIANLVYFRNRELMAFIIPFLLYSLGCFQISLFRMEQSIKIAKNLSTSKRLTQSVLDASQLLVLYLNITSPHLFLYFPNGHIAGELKQYKLNKWNLFGRAKTYSLSNANNQIIGYFKVGGRKTAKIEVFNEKHSYVGSFVKQRSGLLKYGKKQLFDRSGRFVSAIEGSPFYMDEHILNNGEQQVGRLRRGWMPVEWSTVFPEPNTPVFSLIENLPEQKKLLSMSILINEFFIER